jgi:small-conductance mechanosensitive channel
MDNFTLNVLQAISAIVFFGLLDIAFEYLINRRIKEKRSNIIARVRLRYFLFFCLVLVMARIWVEGFGYLITVIGVIAAALTITQKEYLLNFFGWLIIMWRDLFVEGEYIEVGKYMGYVRHIGPLYFTLDEASEIAFGDKTGKMIRIPNSIVAATPVITYSSDRFYAEGKVLVTFTFTSNLERIKSIITTLEKDVEAYIVAKYVKEDIHEERFKLKCYLKFNQDKPLGIQLRVKYFSVRSDRKDIEHRIIDVIMKAVSQAEDVHLSVAS